MVYYMSMEFLLGRALGNNLINMTAYKEVKEALDELGIDLNLLEDQEPDRLLEMAAWDVWLPASWILWQPWVRGLRLRHPLPLWHVQAED